MPELSRRRALTAAAALAAASGAATLAAPAAPAAGQPGSSPAPFDEVYKGRRIQGRARSGGGHDNHHGGDYAVFVDGVELHVMRNADGTWISVVSHYDPVTTPRACARAAVDELRGAALLPFPAN
ncbi:apotyrosinase chaperone MelC1 [Streptomyces sp. P17]|uniref:apotyrosinase chaperone MelC1 n=1 Tax=Streptomyces sp. P17 TaxID=3074716 RepID=UPI0028F3F688|nr:tyrosinase cofactor [Streptomyces sp. P17]MDT9699083.1 tyrosinase cofactor [Streptomyces sp. P17]